MPDKPRLVVISGPPGAGKTTLARPLATRLRLPLIDKDHLKETLAGAFGDTAVDHSAALGHAAFLAMYAVADELLRAGSGVVLEAFFHPELAERDLAPLIERSDPVLVHLIADPELLVSRYIARTERGGRHPVHQDADRVDQLRERLAAGYAKPPRLGIRTIVIDTTYGPVDVDEVAHMITHPTP